MAVGGIPEPVPLHPQRMVELGLAMIAVVERYAAESGLPLALRVGVHTGPVVAGVIGTHKFSYDLWGDTVNVASRLESGGVAGAVQVSEATWRRIGGVFVGEPCGPVELKGVGALETWLVRPGRPAEAARGPTAAPSGETACVSGMMEGCVSPLRRPPSPHASRPWCSASRSSCPARRSPHPRRRQAARHRAPHPP